jgi:hypothetical protein
MSEKPNVTVIYQDARTPTNMGCIEALVSVAALALMAGAAGFGPLAALVAWLWW